VVVLVEDRDVHAADDQLAALGLHLSELKHAVGGVVLEHVDLRDGEKGSRSSSVRCDWNVWKVSRSLSGETGEQQEVPSPCSPGR